MVNTGDGTAPVKVTSNSDAPFDGQSTVVHAAATEEAPRATKTFDQVKLEMRAKAAKLPAPKADATKPAAKTEAAPEAKTKPAPEATTVDGITDAEMTEFVARTKEQRANKAHVKALENDPHLQLGKEIAAAVAAGDHRKAAQLAKIDPTKLTEQEIAASKTPEQEELAQLRAENERLKGDKAQETQAAARAKGREDAADDIVKDATKYPKLAANRDAVVKALVEYEAQYDAFANEKKRALTQSEVDLLINTCLAEAEAAVTPAETTDTHTKRIPYSAQPSQPSQRQQPITNLSSSKSLSFDEAKARIWRK